jgi:CHAT domain-containing protein/Tfp pilus assembly protein PilF
MAKCSINQKLSLFPKGGPMLKMTVRCLPFIGLTICLTLFITAQDKPHSAVEDFAEVLAQKKTAVEWEEALAERKEMESKELVNALIPRCRRLIMQGAYPRAELICGQTRQMAERIGDKAGVIRALSNLGILRSMQGNYALAEEYLRKSLAMSEEAGDRVGIDRALNNLGIIYGSQGDYARAMECYQKSLKLSTDRGDKSQIALVIGNIGSILYEWGDQAQALDRFLESLTISESLGDKEGIARYWGNIGNVYYGQGNYARALKYYRDSLSLRESLNDKMGVAGIRSNIGNVYYRQGNYAQAAEFYQQSLELSKALGYKPGVASGLNNLGNIRYEQNDYARALESHQQSLSMKEEMGDKSGIAASLDNIGLVFGEQGDYTRALEFHRRSLGVRDYLKDKGRMAISLFNIGSVHKKQGSYALSADFARRAAELAREIGYVEILWQACFMEGLAYRDLKQFSQARLAFDDAIRVVETMRIQAAGGEREAQRFLESKISPYLAMVNLLLSENNLPEAFTYVERAKGRVLLDVLRNGRASITKAMTAQEQEQERALNNQIISLNTQVFREKQRDEPNKTRVEAIEKDLEKARLEYEAFETSLYAAHAELKVKRGEAEILKLDEAGAFLPDAGTAALEFVVTEEKTSLFVLTKNAPGSQPLAPISVFTIPIKQKKLEERVKQFRDQVAERDQTFAKNSLALFQLLLGPAAPLLRDKTTLIIVPDGPLWELPFQALQSSGGRYLLKDHAVFYAPSLTVLREMVRLRRQNRTPAANPALLAVGNPALGEQTIKLVEDATMGEKLVPLPAAQRQAEELGRLYGQQRSKVYVGADATEERVKAESSNYNVLHLAAHGALDNRSPMYSHIVLAQTGEKGKEDGLLEAWELMKLDLKADLTVLSACETARGHVAGGEGVIGLSWALFVAGCPTTVVSQWKVNDQSTADLMVEFHRQIKTHSVPQNAGLNSRALAAQALRQAALKLLGNGRYQHPYYWAGFIVVGDGY